MGTFYFLRKISKMTFSFVFFFIHPNLKSHRNERVYLELVTSVKRERERKKVIFDDAEGFFG